MSDKPERKQCEKCEGSGKLDQYGTCTACNGDGWVGSKHNPSTCGTCHGNGKAVGKVKCDNCDGDGFNIVMVSYCSLCGVKSSNCKGHNEFGEPLREEGGIYGLRGNRIK